MGWNEMELINICWNYLERILFGGTWNGTGTERVPIKNRVERNEFQFRVGRNGTSSRKIGMEYNTVESNMGHMMWSLRP